MSKAEFPGGFPEFDAVELDEDEILDFTRRVIWPAAIYFWGTGFRDPNLYDENDDVYAGHESPNGEEYVSLAFYLEDFADRDPGQTVDDIPRELVINVDMDVLRTDLMDIAPKACRGLKVWECLSYQFPVDGSEPWVDHSYMLESTKGREISDPTGQQKDFLDFLDESERYGLERSGRLNSQDLIDIYNMLLALEVAEEVIDLNPR